MPRTDPNLDPGAAHREVLHELYHIDDSPESPELQPLSVAALKAARQRGGGRCRVASDDRAATGVPGDCRCGEPAVVPARLGCTFRFNRETGVVSAVEVVFGSGASEMVPVAKLRLPGLHY